MGNMDGEMESEGNAGMQTLPDTNSVSVWLNYGIIFPSVPYYQSLEGVGGVGGSPDPAFLHPIPFFITFSLLCTPVPHGFGGWVDI